MDVEQSKSQNNHKGETVQCYAWAVAYELFQSSPAPPQKNLASHSYILIKENTFFCTSFVTQNIMIARRILIQQCTFLTPKISVFVHV